MLAAMTSQQEEVLHNLRQKRIRLASEVVRARSPSQWKTPQIHIEQMNLEKKFKAKPKSSFAQLVAQELELSFSVPKSKTNLPTSPQEIRTKRKNMAAYRLGGISAGVPNLDSEILSIRFDICLDGAFVSCYHAFFDIIVETTDGSDNSNMVSAQWTKTNKRQRNGKDHQRGLEKEAGRSNYEIGNDTEQYSSDSHSLAAAAAEGRILSEEPQSKLSYVRLVQHTLPSSIPLAQLTRGIFGGSLYRLGDLQHQNTISQADTWKEKIRTWSRLCYRACWAWERRKQAWAMLREQKTLQHKQEKDETHRFLVETSTIAASNSYDKICFQLQCMNIGELFNDETTSIVLEVLLLYDDWVHGTPSDVKVAPLSESSKQTSTNSSKISLDNKTLVVQVQQMFLHNSVTDALKLLNQMRKEDMAV